MRCRHESVVVEEKALASVSASVVKGVVQQAWESDLWPTSTGTVRCEDCGAARHYSIRNEKRLPRWAIVAVAAFDNRAPVPAPEAQPKPTKEEG